MSQNVFLITINEVNESLQTVNKYLGWPNFCYVFSPPGVFELPNFASGTKAVMDAVVSATENGATTIIGQ